MKMDKKKEVPGKVVEPVEVIFPDFERWNLLEHPGVGCVLAPKYVFIGSEVYKVKVVASSTWVVGDRIWVPVYIGQGINFTVDNTTKLFSNFLVAKHNCTTSGIMHFVLVHAGICGPAEASGQTPITYYSTNPLHHLEWHRCCAQGWA